MIRFFDLIFSGIALMILSPFLLPIILILRFTGEGEIFFLQERVGKHYIKFKIFKFVTMIKDSPTIGTGTVTMKDDPRILPIGKFLRRTKINELPQLLNIFLGHMSLIGPRPQTPSCFEAFTHDAQSIIAQVKPGLSGIGPIVFRGEEDILNGQAATLDFYDNVIAPYKGDVEAWYSDKQKLSVYFTLIFLTAWVVCFPRSPLVWVLIKDLPIPPDELKKELNFPHINRIHNKNIPRYAFGWNYKAWSYVFKSANLPGNNKYARILEIGASRNSICSIIFDGYAEEIIIGYYDDSERVLIEKYLSNLSKKLTLKSKYFVEKVDAHSCTGSYDLVIMKSVLGGLFRTNNSSLDDVKLFICDLNQRVLNEKGSLITVDNGESFLENLLSNFGARKNKWRFFLRTDLNMAVNQFQFGLLSGFSLGTRWGIFGHFIDNYIVYPVDYVLFAIVPNKPTVILSIFSKSCK